MRGQKVMDTFYDRLKETWSYHTHHPGLPVSAWKGKRLHWRVFVERSALRQFVCTRLCYVFSNRKPSISRK